MMLWISRDSLQRISMPMQRYANRKPCFKDGVCLLLRTLIVRPGFHQPGMSRGADLPPPVVDLAKTARDYAIPSMTIWGRAGVKSISSTVLSAGRLGSMLPTGET